MPEGYQELSTSLPESVSTYALRSVLRVGDGRGFVIEADGRHLVVTAAHCLPPGPDGQRLPPAHGASFLEERTYANLLGSLGSEATIWAECLFVDPIADIAVLGSPDNQELSDAAEAYEALVYAAVPLEIGMLAFASERFMLPDGTEFDGAPVAASDARLLALEGHWFSCRAQSRRGRSLWIKDAAESIRGGMSGSLIMAPDGRAIGIVSISAGDFDGDHREGGPNPFLVASLPGWLIRDVTEPAA